MQVYSTGYLARMEEALEEVYETTYKTIDHDSLHGMIHDYARAHPPKGFSLADAGEHLSAFLSKHSISKTYPFLSDLAKFEWHLHVAFHAQQFTPASPTQLNSIPAEKWPELTLEWQPAVGVIRSEWGIYELWKNRKKDEFKIDKNILERPTCLLIYRSGFDVMTATIEPEEYHLLELLLKGSKLGNACQTLVEKTDHPPNVTPWFGRWMQLGLIAKIKLP